MIHLFIYYISYLSFPFLALVAYFSWKYWGQWKKSKLQLFTIGLLVLLSVSFIYGRFIERYQVNTQTTNVEVGFSGRVIVASDLHLGVYKKKSFLKKVVKKINEQENIDAVLIPGDFTYYPKESLNTLFEPIKEIKFPVFAVLGNHDDENPGPPLQKELKDALESYGVNFLHNEKGSIPNTNIKILGLGDIWGGEDKIELIDQYSEEDNLIVITHNPDTTSKYKNNKADLTVAGHTHGGQIRLPFIYKSVIPCEGDFDQGLYIQKTGKTFVTSGLGEVGLPMRLAIPPVIDILELY